MFNKLLSNLPFNPSLIDQVSFYARRLHEESSVRRLGFIFAGMAMLIQLFAFMSPPQPTLARSGNDLIEGGIGSISDAVFHCQNNTGGFGTIANYFGITCENIAASGVVTLNSRSYDSQLFSMGRLAYGKAGETPITINGTTYWLRYLWSWDGISSSSYTALQGTSTRGHTFFVLFDCGNLVFVGLPPPPPPPPPANCPLEPSLLESDSRCKPCPYDSSIIADNTACKPCEESQTIDDKTACLELSKTVENTTKGLSDANGTTARGNDTLTYTLRVRNNGKADIDNFVVQENISDVLDYASIVNLNGAEEDENHIISWPALTIRSQETVEKTFTVKVKNPVPQTPASSSDPGHFDLVMTNVYGNAVSVKLPPSPSKRVEAAAHNLPNTGPGTGLMAGFALLIFIGYFYARSRVVAKEFQVIKSDYSAGIGV